jgi:outer membrane protein assembly factor BamE (lipoprotein component of BamABCDE complex)
MSLLWQILKIGSIALAGLWLLGCDPKVAERGRQDLLEMAGNIIPGQTHRNDVMRMLGTPSSVSQFGEPTWYYVSLKNETVAFLEPDVVDQNVLRVIFDGDTVKDVEFYDKTLAKDVAISSRETPTSGQEYGFFEQLVGNIGRFNKKRDPLSNTATMPPG